MRTIGKIILIALGLLVAWYVFKALTAHKVGGRQAAPYRPVTPDCRDPILGLPRPELLKRGHG